MVSRVVYTTIVQLFVLTIMLKPNIS